MKLDSVGIKDVATAAGVSLGTVSNVLNRPELVSDSTRSRVQAAIDELGFVRNGSAARLRSSTSTTIGLVVLDVANPYFTEVARGVEETAEAKGFTVMLCNADGSAAREERHLSFLEEQRVAGVLVTPTHNELSARRLDALRARGMAIVLVDERAGAADRCSVAVDDLLGGELAARHLIDGGRRSIVMLSGPSSIRQVAEREAGVRRAVAAAAEPVELHIVRVSTLNGTAGHGAADEVLAHHPDAVFGVNDLLTLGVLRRLIELGINVPDEIALVGYDDIEFAGLAAVPLTSVRQPALQIGRTSARLLLEECTEPGHAHQHVLFRPELIVRQSSGPRRSRPAADAPVQPR